MGITLPAGWRIENPPPENTFLAASKGEVATLLGIHTDSKNADDAFERMKKVASDNFGKLVNFSEKIKLDPADGRHARMQTFQLSSGGSAYLFIGGLQHGPRVIALLGVFKGTDVYNEFVDSLKTISW